MFYHRQCKNVRNITLYRLGEKISKISKKENDCLAALLDEIQQATVWSRPSVLIAVHQSKNDQIRAMRTLKNKLDDLQIRVATFVPKSGLSNILQDIIQKSVSIKTVCFVHGLGTQSLQYDGLNLFREVLVDQRLKLILWLTLDEVTLLSHKAPDFWGFRHRVIEFPTKRSSRKDNLPSGVLLWHRKALGPKVDVVYDEIAFYKTLLQNIPSQDESITTHADAVSSLAYCYWVTGENQKVFDTLHREIEHIKRFQLNEIQSILLNALAINSFDQENYQESFRWIEEAVELNPLNSLLWSNMGIICRSAGKSRKSFPSLKKAVRLNPASPESWGVMGYLYMSLGKYESAFPLFEKALALHPENIRFYPALAVCHSQMGNIEDFTEVVQQITVAAKDDEYLALYRDGLLGDDAAVVGHLRGLVLREKSMQVFIRRDPNIRFILDPIALQEVFLVDRK